MKDKLSCVFLAVLFYPWGRTHLPGFWHLYVLRAEPGILPAETWAPLRSGVGEAQGQRAQLGRLPSGRSSGGSGSAFCPEGPGKAKAMRSAPNFRVSPE